MLIQIMAPGHQIGPQQGKPFLYVCIGKLFENLLLKNHPARKAQKCRLKFVKIMALRMSDGATIAEIIFTCVYIGKIFISRTMRPQKFKLTQWLSYLVKIEVYKNYCPMGSVPGATIVETIFTRVYLAKKYLNIFFLRTTRPEKFKSSIQYADSSLLKPLPLGFGWGHNCGIYFYMSIYRTNLPLKNHEVRKVQTYMEASFQILCRFKFLFKSLSPGSVGATIVEIIFTCVYIGKIFFSRTTVRQKFKLTLWLSYIVQIKVCKPFHLYQNF